MKKTRSLFLCVAVICWLLLAWFVWESSWQAGESLSGELVAVGALAGLAISGGVFHFQRSRDRDAVDELKDELGRQAVRLEKERQELLLRMGTHHGLDEAYWELRAGAAETDEDDESTGPAELRRRDQEVVNLMRSESERVFQNLLDNAYVVDGEFDQSRLGDELVRFVESVARIYQPDSDHPLLETSLEKLLRAVNRVSVQLLVHLDQLPLDVKSYNIREAYGRVRSATKYYGYYKKVEPYWSYARPVYHLGRLALGANPITIGVGWAVSEAIKRGSTNLAHSWALRMFHDTVRIFGNETAEVFGENYRQRDAGWLCCRELVTLATEASDSSQVREAALRKVWGAPLRSEYDRLFFLGCLARREAPKSDAGLAMDSLSLSERQNLIRTLESFVAENEIDLSSKKGEVWKSSIVTAYGVRFQEGGSLSLTVEEQWGSALRALVGFLLQYKALELEDALERVRETELPDPVSEEDRRAFEDELRAAPPMLYEVPDLDPGSDVLKAFLKSMLSLEFGCEPRLPGFERLLEEAAGYCREPAGTWTIEYGRECKRTLAHLEGDASRLSAEQAKAVLTTIDPEEELLWIYTGISGREDALLCGTCNRLILIENTAVDPRTMWIGNKGDVTSEKVSHPIRNDCSLKGGAWQIESAERDDEVVVQGRTISTYANRFRPLLRWCAENR